MKLRSSTEPPKELDSEKLKEVVLFAIKSIEGITRSPITESLIMNPVNFIDLTRKLYYWNSGLDSMILLTELTVFKYEETQNITLNELKIYMKNKKICLLKLR